MVLSAVSVAWLGLLWLAWLLGRGLVPAVGRHLGIGAAPFVGRWHPLLTFRLSVPLTLAAAAVVWGPAFVTRARWPVVQAAAALASAAWVLALGFVDGAGRLTTALGSRYDYLAAVGDVGSPGRFLATFAARVPTFPTHVKSHPPGLVVVLWCLDRLGWGGTGPALALVLVGGGLAVISVLAAGRSLAGEAWARRAAPFVAFAPAAVFATNADLLYAGLAAAGLALVVLAAREGPSARAALRAAGAGGVLGAGLLCSYGIALFALPVLAVLVPRRRWLLLGLTGGAAALVVVAPAAWGFWYPEGWAAARAEYWQGLASRRPGDYFAWANLVAGSALLGPVGLAALVRFRARALRPVVVGSVGMVAVATASQLSKGEVERIWLPFAPWLLLACGALGRRPGGHDAPPSRAWLAAHLATGLGLQVALRSPW